MPERLTSTITVDSTKVQSEGSFVKIKALLWGEGKDVAKWETVDGDKATDTIEQFLTEHVLEWNWVDGDGQPLPQLSQENCLDRLTKAEMAYLIAITTGS